MNRAESTYSDLRAAFVEKAGWGDAVATPLAGDASTRSYERLEKDGRRAVLMIAPPGAEAATCPANATPEQRHALGYNATARLAGPNLNAFVTLSNNLQMAGLSAPEIYAADAATGFALIEDLGDDLFARIIDREDETLLYQTAIDALIALRNANPPRPSDDQYTMLNYDLTALAAEADLLIDWYWPLKHKNDISHELRTEFVALWRDQLRELSAPHSFVLRDYHAENLIWLPDRSGVERVGIIDFQDALYGCAAYDLASLLEDARRDVDPEFADQMIEYYVQRAAAVDVFDRATFERDYAILAAQRNAKILGVFARLARRDKKPRYLDLLPRVEGHFRRDLKRPNMAALQDFFARNFDEFSQ